MDSANRNGKQGRILFVPAVGAAYLAGPGVAGAAVAAALLLASGAGAATGAAGTAGVAAGAGVTGLAGAVVPGATGAAGGVGGSMEGGKFMPGCIPNGATGRGGRG